MAELATSDATKKNLIDRLGLRPILKAWAVLVGALDFVEHIHKLLDYWREGSAYAHKLGIVFWDFVLFPFKFLLLTMFTIILVYGFCGIMYQLINFLSGGRLKPIVKKYEERSGQGAMALAMVVAGWCYYKYGFVGSLKLLLS
jgi:hypothetical protein